MLLLVGLGNPGSGYVKNRHNIGFMAADEIVRRHSFGPWRNKFQAEICDGMIAGTKAYVLKPLTFMNESGRAVGACAQFYKIPVSQIIVLHDELDLPAGKLRVKTGGGHGGHNGLRSIDAHLGAKDYRRIRLGIGHPGDKAQVHGHVLSDFAKADGTWLTPLLDAVADHIGLLVRGDDGGFMNKVTLATRPPKNNKDD
ncbi:aminoacyl-tRNA hydrolase [Magnetospira sp. QH-2]|uniref:aminoacyl-tRNA hydrolase n=1 Tax=Magnetospira sp. (strain QH-2) TaxID=1288970 RepID=UPI0003E817F9|nr:peptidyl-tRNA hydrolase [Magnetospira sp. QH-2]